MHAHQLQSPHAVLQGRSRASRPSCRPSAGVVRASSDPFNASAGVTGAASAPGSTQAVPSGFLAPGQSRDALVQVSDADTLLRRYDTEWMAAQRASKSAAGAAGSAFPTTQCTAPALRAACVSLAARSGSVMLGLCAEDSAAGVAALKAWTTGLGLPRRLLHGMDTNGVPNTIQGAVFIKYNSASGDAFLSGYAGDARGVLFTPGLPDGVFRQFGYLPLSLLDTPQ